MPEYWEREKCSNIIPTRIITAEELRSNTLFGFILPGPKTTNL
jgi:hypothetical protein